MQLTVGVRMWVSSLKKPQHGKPVMCSVRHQPALKLMHVKLMFYFLSHLIFFSPAHIERSNVMLHFSKLEGGSFEWRAVQNHLVCLQLFKYGNNNIGGVFPGILHGIHSACVVESSHQFYTRKSKDIMFKYYFDQSESCPCGKYSNLSQILKILKWRETLSVFVKPEIFGSSASVCPKATHHLSFQTIEWTMCCTKCFTGWCWKDKPRLVHRH